jgi:hypothetical protein
MCPSCDIFTETLEPGAKSDSEERKDFFIDGESAREDKERPNILVRAT